MRFIYTLIGILVASVAVAQTDAEKDFRIEGNVLYFDTETSSAIGEISSSHVEVMLGLLKQTPSIEVLELNSDGGSVWAGQEMSRIALDFELTTRVNGECSSSCVLIFLAGVSRTLERGSKIGFHSRNWSASSIERYYEKWRDEENWQTPFQFSSWVYEDARAEVFHDLEYLMSRGIDPVFAVKTLSPRKDMWYPTRGELRGAGILVE